MHVGHPPVRIQQIGQFVEGRRLVVDGQHDEAHARTPGWNFGTRMLTFVPAPGAVSTTRPK